MFAAGGLGPAQGSHKSNLSKSSRVNSALAKFWGSFHSFEHAPDFMETIIFRQIKTSHPDFCPALPPPPPNAF